MLSKSTLEYLAVLEAFDRAIMILATGSEPLPDRLISAWSEVRDISREPCFKQLPAELRKRILEIESQIKMGDDIKSTVKRMTSIQHKELVRALYDISIRSAVKAGEWTNELEKQSRK